VRNCYVKGGVLISFLISRSTGISIATAKKRFCTDAVLSTVQMKTKAHFGGSHSVEKMFQSRLAKLIEN